MNYIKRKQVFGSNTWVVSSNQGNPRTFSALYSALQYIWRTN